MDIANLADNGSTATFDITWDPEGNTSELGNIVAQLQFFDTGSLNITNCATSFTANSGLALTWSSNHACLVTGGGSGMLVDGSGVDITPGGGNPILTTVLTGVATLASVTVNYSGFGDIKVRTTVGNPAWSNILAVPLPVSKNLAGTTLATLPEPSTFALLALSMAGLAARRRRIV